MLTAHPAFQGLAYQSAEISTWLGFSAMDFTAARSKDWTSSSLSKSPSFIMSTKNSVMPPSPKLPFMPRSRMASLT